MATTTDTLTAAGHSLGYTGSMTLAFQVMDMAKAIDWYQDTLGFKLMYKLDEMGWCELSTADRNILVGLSQVEEPKVAGGPVPTFGVKDIDEARRQLEAKGVRFDGATREIPEMVKLATFYDPDGNTLMLHESLAEQP
ncbi:MAG: VOC family protein [Phycisphaerales bacterium]|nr:VOC family protein [Phycisphaerae bacterium]NNF42132.1 VOC family protein [Phycisphaerales bacterium]NNM25207.1 VOC family protein [Phycisphaerales bacterium]